MHVAMCPKCNQLVTTARDPHLIVENASPQVCDVCRERDREPQGETTRLFAPAPNVIPGQQGFAV